jgi:hypothetical protein
MDAVPASPSSGGVGGGGRFGGGGCISGAGGPEGEALGCALAGPMSGRALLCTTDAAGSTGVRSTRISSQYASAATSPSRPMIGKKTSGGRVITSKPPRPELAVRTTGDALGVGEGDCEGEADGVGEGDAGGVGVGAPCSVKFAHGGAWFNPSAEPHSLCTPGLPPGNGITLVVNDPPMSADVEPATWLVVSQYRLTAAPGGKLEPLTEIFVLGPPAAVSSTIQAWVCGGGVGTPLAV